MNNEIKRAIVDKQLCLLFRLVFQFEKFVRFCALFPKSIFQMMETLLMKGNIIVPQQNDCMRYQFVKWKNNKA